MVGFFGNAGGFGSPFGAGAGGMGGPPGPYGPGSPFMGQNFVGQQYAAGGFGGPQMGQFGQPQSPFGMGGGMSPFGPSRPFRSIPDNRKVVFEQEDD